MWETPVYRFRILENEEDGQAAKLKEVVIDVTGSAPPFTEPSDALKEVLKHIFENYNVETVLEFGAAKLKNIPFILNYGKTVSAVEFKELADNQFTKKNLKKCEKFKPKFQELIFPNPFLTDKKKFDLALLINVMPVMPIPSERLYLLDLLYNKVKDNKYLLWVAQKEGSYKKIREEGKNSCGDGIWMGRGRYMKTFYRYHPIEELDEIMALYGFTLVKRFDVGDDARLYVKNPYNIFHGLVTPEGIRENIPLDSTIKDPTDKEKLKIVKKSSKLKVVSPNPKQFSIENLYIEKIKSIKKGADNAEEYHRAVSYALSRIFRGSLRNMDIKVDIDGGIKIVDTVFTNSADKGFFHNLKSKIECNYPMIEVKNISGDTTNPELDQLNGRLNQNRGHFGILICREVSDKKAVISRCKTYLPANYIIVLSDEDIFELLKYTREKNENSINDLMDDRLKSILF